MQIREITTADRQIINAVVDIHMETFTGFFLTFLGKGFLRQMYCSYCEYEDSGLLVAFEADGEPVGFLAYSAQISGLYKHMLKKRLIPFGWYALWAFIRKPTIFMRLVRAFLKSGENKREESYVELASIGVKPEWKRHKVGTCLIDTLKQQVDFDRHAYILLNTDAVNNEGANRFYCENGFVCSRTFATKEGRKMNEYRFRKKV